MALHCRCRSRRIIFRWFRRCSRVSRAYPSPWFPVAVRAGIARTRSVSRRAITGKPAEHEQPSASSDDDGGADDGPVPAATFESVYSLVTEHYVDALPPDRDMSVWRVALDARRALNDPQRDLFLDADAKIIFQNESEGPLSRASGPVVVRPERSTKDGYTDHKIVVVSTLYLVLPPKSAQDCTRTMSSRTSMANGCWVRTLSLKVNRIVQKVGGRATRTRIPTKSQKESDQARRQRKRGHWICSKRTDAAARRRCYPPRVSNCLTDAIQRYHYSPRDNLLRLSR